jgi:NAD(P)-dependent dehydrogenase (short-subunit alcohol dehydrogenase family)
MDLQVQGKRALVTGSSSGIGEAIAKTLAAEGVAVVVHGRREQEAVRVAREITAGGGKAAVALGDLANDAEADAVVKKALADFGGIDILVNNAGAYWQKPWLETTPADWNELYNQNVASMVRMVRGLVPGMKERRWGRVIAIASGVGSFPFPPLAAYSATKGANINLAVGLAKELAGTGITSNAVSPGPILTPAFEQWVNAMAEQKGWPKEWAQREALFVKEVTPNPSNRIGRVWDIADMVAFLSSPRAGYVNGANIRVDGGAVSSVN